MRLRSHLLRWLLIPLALLWAVGLRIHLDRTLAQANEAYDRTLLGSALVIAERLEVHDGQPTIDLPNAALDMLQTHAQDRIFYKVSIVEPPDVLAGYDDLPPPPLPPVGDAPRFYNAAYKDEPVRIVALQRPIYGLAVRGPLLVQVAETIGAREALARRSLIDVSLMQLASMAAAALLIALGVQRGLAPLRRLRDEVRRRAGDDLRPLAVQHVPREVAPLIDAINLQTERQRALNEAHRQFIADASHQLKTPLTVLKAQAAQALKALDQPAQARRIVQDMHDSTDVTARVVQQLLGLARSEPSHQMPDEPLDFAAAARQATFDQLPQAMAQQIDLGFEAAAPALVVGQPLLLHELVANLVDNAVRYTPAGGRVDVRVDTVEPGAVRLCVEDTGPGIPAADRDKVFNRFYRLPGSSADGCGLGLAIVRQIALRHAARITLDEGAGGGLRVQVAFAAQGAAGLPVPRRDAAGP